GSISGNESITVGANALAINVSVVVGGTLTVNAGNTSGTITITSPVGGIETVSIGNGATLQVGNAAGPAITLGDGLTITGGSGDSIHVNNITDQNTTINVTDNTTFVDVSTTLGSTMQNLTITAGNGLVLPGSSYFYIAGYTILNDLTIT